MPKLFNQLILAASAIFMVACDTASTDNNSSDATETKDSVNFNLSNVRSSIETENAKLIDGIKKGDSAAIASNYTSDAWIMPPNSEAVRGNDIAPFWGTFIRMGVKDMKLSTDDISGNEEQIAETGTYEIYGSESKLLDKGKYIVVWKSVNGSWKMYRDIFNTSMPAATAK